MAILPTDIQILFTNYDIIAYMVFSKNDLKSEIRDEINKNKPKLCKA
jgi:hypothetical protein